MKFNTPENNTLFHEIIRTKLIEDKIVSVERIGDDYSIYETSQTGFVKSLFSSNTMIDVVSKFDEMFKESS